jgi:hypothetical protein
MSDKNKQLAEKINKLEFPITLKDETEYLKTINTLLDEAYPEPPDEVTPAYVIKDCDCAKKIRALEEQTDLLESQFAEAKAVLVKAAEEMEPFEKFVNYKYRTLKDDYPMSVGMAGDTFYDFKMGNFRRLASVLADIRKVVGE